LLGSLRNSPWDYVSAMVRVANTQDNAQSKVLVYQRHPKQGRQITVQSRRRQKMVVSGNDRTRDTTQVRKRQSRAQVSQDDVNGKSSNADVAQFDRRLFESEAQLSVTDIQAAKISDITGPVESRGASRGSAGCANWHSGPQGELSP